tara:strand:+ start:1077 stop:3227 length:2151 start_codon:yes stop_codon:yes gene_type:complete
MNISTKEKNTVSTKDKAAIDHLNKQAIPRPNNTGDRLAFINPQEMTLLDQLTDGGAINKGTGLVEFDVGDGDGDPGSSDASVVGNDIGGFSDDDMFDFSDPFNDGDFVGTEIDQSYLEAAEKATDLFSMFGQLFGNHSTIEFNKDTGLFEEGGNWGLGNFLASPVTSGIASLAGGPLASLAVKAGQNAFGPDQTLGQIDNLSFSNVFNNVSNPFTENSLDAFENSINDLFGGYVDDGKELEALDVLAETESDRRPPLALLQTLLSSPQFQQSTLQDQEQLFSSLLNSSNTSTVARPVIPGSFGEQLDLFNEQQSPDFVAPPAPPAGIPSLSPLEKLVANAKDGSRDQDDDPLFAPNFFRNANQGLTSLKINRPGGLSQGAFNSLVQKSKGDADLFTRKLQSLGVIPRPQEDDRGNTTNLNNVITQLNQQAAEEEQKRQDSILNTEAAASAFSNAIGGVDSLVEELGLTGQGFASDARTNLLDILRDFTPGAGQVNTFNSLLNADVGRSLGQQALDTKTQEFQNFGNTQISSIFPEDGFNIDQSIIDSIVEDRIGQGSKLISNQQARGNFNPIGAQNANTNLQAQKPEIRQQVSDVAQSFVPAVNDRFNDIRTRAQEANNSFVLGDDLFDVTAFTDERDNFLNDQSTGFRSQIDDAIGSNPLFDIDSALGAGRRTQGLVSGGPRGGGILDTLAARQAQGGSTQQTNRGISTTGNGAF